MPTSSKNLEKRDLGRTGLQITRLGFGAWAIGSRGSGNVERGDAEAALEAYINAGGNFIDTARGYGDSEKIIGEFLQARPGLREKLVIASKLGMHDPQELREGLQDQSEPVEFRFYFWGTSTTVGIGRRDNIGDILLIGTTEETHGEASYEAENGL